MEWLTGPSASWRRERDSNPRALRLPVFKTGGFNHSPIPPALKDNKLLPIFLLTRRLGRAAYRNRNYEEAQEYGASPRRCA